MYSFTSDWFSSNIPLWQEVLQHLCNQPTQILEIGSYEGRASVYLLENVLTHPESSLTCVDTWEGSEEHTEDQKIGLWERFQHNVSHFPDSTVHIHRGRSDVVLRKMEPVAKYDMIYIDADHSAKGVMSDIVLSFPLLKKGGILIFDDYLWDGMQNMIDRPMMAIHAFFTMWEKEYRILYMGYQVVVQKIV